MKKILLSSILLTGTLLQAENLAVASDPKDIALTLYGNNMAMVTEKRTASIPKIGKAKLVYPGVPSMIDTSSVLATFSKPVKLYSQNYSYDVISYNSLLKYHLGKSIIYIDTEESKEPKRGILLSENPILIKEAVNGVIFTPYKVFFPNIPQEMAIKPSLFWNMQTKAKELDIGLKYLTTGITWQSDYTINLSTDKELELNSWISITNNSGATYNDANITVLAGEVNMPKEPSPSRLYYKRKSITMAAPHEENIESESFSGYHIYPIPFKESIKDKQKKQIAFIGKSGVSYMRYALYKEQNNFLNYGEKKLNFDQIVEFKNSKINHLGIPLPKGTVRVYQNDTRGKSHFVGANTINNTPKDETVKFSIGKYFDIVGKEKVLEYKKTTSGIDIKYETTLNNRSKQSQIVKIQKSVPRNSGKLTINDSCEKQCTKEAKNAFLTHYTIVLKPDETYIFTIAYSVKKY